MSGIVSEDVRDAQALDRSGLRYNANEQFAAIHWIEGGYGYVVSGPIDKPRLKAIARAAYEQMENRPPPPPPAKATGAAVQKSPS
mgnify:CR=1 FL=1